MTLDQRNPNPANTAPADNRGDARERLRSAVDQLANRANLYAQMQKDPLKLIGGASGVGLLLGVLIGSRFKRTRKIYVDANSSKREQKAFARAQHRGGNKGGIGGALVAGLTTIGIKVLQDRVLRPQLEKVADQMAERTRQPRAAGSTSSSTQPAHDPKRPM